jgi:hypothetical protein
VGTQLDLERRQWSRGSCALKLFSPVRACIFYDDRLTVTLTEADGMRGEPLRHSLIIVELIYLRMFVWREICGRACVKVKFWWRIDYLQFPSGDYRHIRMCLRI